MVCLTTYTSLAEGLTDRVWTDFFFFNQEYHIMNFLTYIKYTDMYTNIYMHLYFLKNNILEANNITTMQNCVKSATSTMNNN